MSKKFPLVRVKQFLGNPAYVWFWLRRVFKYKQSSYKNISDIKKIKQMSDSETLSTIISDNKSIIRFGDGEFGLLSGAGIYPPDSDWSQKYSKKLKYELIRQLKLDNPNIIIAIPPKSHLIYRVGDFPELDVIPSMHTEARLFLPELVNPYVTFGVWSVFMPQHHKNINWQKIANHIKNKTAVIVTGGTEKISDIKLGNETLFVECGKHNAFERRYEIMKSIDDLIEKENLQKENTLFWVSLGCTAGCIIEHLVEQGYVGWDTGHIFRFAEKELRQIG